MQLVKNDAFHVTYTTEWHHSVGESPQEDTYRYIYHLFNAIV